MRVEFGALVGKGVVGIPQRVIDKKFQDRILEKYK